MAVVVEWLGARCIIYYITSKFTLHFDSFYKTGILTVNKNVLKYPVFKRLKSMNNPRNSISQI